MEHGIMWQEVWMWSRNCRAIFPPRKKGLMKQTNLSLKVTYMLVSTIEPQKAQLIIIFFF